MDIPALRFSLPAGEKPKKFIGGDGKLAEPENPCTATSKDIVNDIMDGRTASNNPEAALQRIFSILAVLPSVHLGLIDPDSLTLSGNSTAVASHSSPFDRHLPSCSRSLPLPLRMPAPLF